MDKVISTGDAKHCLIMALPSVVAVADPVGEKDKATQRVWGGSQRCRDFNGSGLPSVGTSLQSTDKPNQKLHTV